MLKVLLVDDNKITVHGLKTMLAERAKDTIAELAVAYNGKEALATAAKFAPNVVITDIRMPIMDGLNLAKELKESMPGTELMIISSYDEFEYAKKAMEYGVSDFILKPIDTEKIDGIAQNLKALDERLNNLSAAAVMLADKVRTAPFLEAVKEGRADDCRRLLEELAETVGNDFAAYKKIVSELTLVLFDFAHKIGALDGEGASLEDTLLAINMAQSVPILRETAGGVCQKLCEEVIETKNFAADKLASAIKRYIRANYTLPDISLASIAKQFNISQSYLCTIFKKYNFMSIASFITQLRMEEACRCLRETSLKVAEIAKKAGYYDAHYFMRVFKKYFDLSPSEYRRKFIRRSLK